MHKLLYKKPVVVGIGELLWDMLPNSSYLGGAPANFAYHCGQLGCQSIVISRVGNDDLGNQALQSCLSIGLSTNYIQIDQNHPTGVVNVKLDKTGQPNYEIIANSAWDFIQWQGDLRSLADSADIICFGTLAQRNKKSRETIQKFLSYANRKVIKIFDVNLRANFYNRDIIEFGLRTANVVKLNQDEFNTILDILNPYNNPVMSAKEIVDTYSLDMLCITLGENGCRVITSQVMFECPVEQVKIADTVGAGDAFTAALAFNILTGQPVNVAAKAANILGGFVASQKGATPRISKTILKRVIPS